MRCRGRTEANEGQSLIGNLKKVREEDVFWKKGLETYQETQETMEFSTKDRTLDLGLTQRSRIAKYTTTISEKEITCTLEKGNGILASYTCNQRKGVGWKAEPGVVRLDHATQWRSKNARWIIEVTKGKRRRLQREDKKHELTLENLAKWRSPSTTRRWRRRERVWGAQRCVKVGWEAEAREVKRDTVKGRSSAWRTDI